MHSQTVYNTKGTRAHAQCAGRPHRLGLPILVCVECLPADKPWDVVFATRRSSGVSPRACVRVFWCRRILNTYIIKDVDRVNLKMTKRSLGRSAILGKALRLSTASAGPRLAADAGPLSLG